MLQACEAADRYVQAWLPSCSAPALVTLKRAHSKRPRSMITLPLAALIVSAGVRGTSRRDQPLCGSCASCEFKCNYMHRYIHIYVYVYISLLVTVSNKLSCGLRVNARVQTPATA